MQDLGSYGIIAQCFEFLCTLGDEAPSLPDLAESEPEADRRGVDVPFRARASWHDGTDFTSARRRRHARLPVRR
jgi:hypothetical protein